MRNYQPSKRAIVRKSAKTNDILTIFFQNINTVLENATTINTTCTTWKWSLIQLIFSKVFPKVFSLKRPI